jgi:uncharacterized protein (TIGR04255 family)
MTQPTRFPNAPITEAVLDIRVRLPKETDLAQLERLQDSIADRYPQKRVRKAWEGELRFSPEHGLELGPKSGGTIGYLFASADNKQAVQARLDGFSFSRFKPYVSWETLRDEARALWERYREVARPLTITRVALRYINRIEIPLPFGDFKEYILTVPEVAPGLPQGLADFFLRLVIPLPDIGATAIVSETLEHPTESSPVVPLIFDIDVFRLGSIDVGGEAYWTYFEQLRRSKNDLFFRSLTDKAKELFQ